MINAKSKDIKYWELSGVVNILTGNEISGLPHFISEYNTIETDAEYSTFSLETLDDKILNLYSYCKENDLTDLIDRLTILNSNYQTNSKKPYTEIGTNPNYASYLMGFGFNQAKYTVGELERLTNYIDTTDAANEIKIRNLLNSIQATYNDIQSRVNNYINDVISELPIKFESTTLYDKLSEVISALSNKTLNNINNG